LRLAKWSERERVKGDTSRALWIRHIAEVIRRGFEEAYGVEWLEEDHAFGQWLPGGRELVFGSDRPLDQEQQTKPYVAWTFGLLRGSVLRWYVEGETEYHAVLGVLSAPSQMGIELVNLRGNLAAERDNAALKLRDWLLEDQKLKRLRF